MAEKCQKCGLSLADTGQVENGRKVLACDKGHPTLGESADCKGTSELTEAAGVERYEEKMINGIMHYRAFTNEKWMPYGLDEISYRYNQVLQEFGLEASESPLGGEEKK